MRRTISVFKFPLAEGLSEHLTEVLGDLDDYDEVAYTTYVDVMSPTATPMLVAIVTTYALIDVDPDDYEPYEPDPSNIANVA